MTRISDVAETIQDYIDEPHLYEDGDLAVTAARAINDDGHLLPDLPDPTFRDEDGWNVWSRPVLRMPDSEVWAEVGRVDMEPIPDDEDLSPDEARNLAHALLAAADYAERSQN